jgi:hypothetical protein
MGSCVAKVDREFERAQDEANHTSAVFAARRYERRYEYEERARAYRGYNGGYGGHGSAPPAYGVDHTYSGGDSGISGGGGMSGGGSGGFGGGD